MKTDFCPSYIWLLRVSVGLFFLITQIFFLPTSINAQVPSPQCLGGCLTNNPFLSPTMPSSPVPLIPLGAAQPTPCHRTTFSNALDPAHIKHRRRRRKGKGRIANTASQGLIQQLLQLFQQLLQLLTQLLGGNGQLPQTNNPEPNQNPTTAPPPENPSPQNPNPTGNGGQQPCPNPSQPLTQTPVPTLTSDVPQISPVPSSGPIAGSEKTCPSGGSTASIYPTGPAAPVSGTGTVNITAIGSLETVYDHNANGCYNDLPDTGTTAYHDASCNANMSESEAHAYRQTGPTLNNLQPTNCKVTYSSANDTNYADEEYHEWISSTYTEDGTNVYALVHDEWYSNLISSCNNVRIDNITLAVSIDGGATFHHPANYKVFKPGAPWTTSMACPGGSQVWGPSEPSGIVKHNSYYYVTYWQGNDPASHSVAGTCVARTADITQAGTWQVYANGNWVPALSNDCTPISNLGGLHGSLSWSSYLNKFIMVGGGYSISTSPDMITWSNPAHILTLSQLSEGKTQADGYPSFLDPADTSMTFQNIGQTPYLYFVIQPNGTPMNSFNIVRQQIKFN